jgi:predicted site-specific integrase-resolvase
MKTYKIGEFAKELNLSVKTLQNWDKSGFLKAYRNPSNQRFYTEEQLISILKQPEEEKTNKKVIGYCRVSTSKQKESLDNQIQYLRDYTNAKGIILGEVYTDIGSGINYNRKNFNKILEEVENQEISQIYVTYKDRFVRFGFDWFNDFCKRHGAEIIVLNQPSTSPEQELAEDLLNIVTVFSARSHGLRTYKKQIEDGIKKDNQSKSKLLE